MGAGRVVYQEITRISKAIKDKEFFDNDVLVSAIDKSRASGGSVHLMGLVSDGGVHSSMDHISALIALCAQRGQDKVVVHAFTDGRDVPPKSAGKYLGELLLEMERLGCGRIATVSGRYWAMDRDKHWERVSRAYEAMVLGRGVMAPNVQAAVEASYENRVTDEFIEPAVIVDDEGKPLAAIQDGDTVIFFNFRADRAREITRALVDKDFSGFERTYWPQVNYVCMTQYDVTIDAPVAFPPQDLTDILGDILARAGKRQLRIAETEKYAHVTFFFNGGVEEPFPGEDRVLIPSPRVATYNLKPEMSAPELTERLLTELDRDVYDVVVVNYANPDMVGHTGVLEAAVQAVKTVDECLMKVAEAVLAKGGAVLITADHGNAEMMYDSGSESPHTAHTTDKVPFILVDEGRKAVQLRTGGALGDIAPTMLQIMGIGQPAAMTGVSLIET
jgi:2,3-bisphosphoglycerate-independent phosphoglycerate mutase